jgi:hypothetical protein
MVHGSADLARVNPTPATATIPARHLRASDRLSRPRSPLCCPLAVCVRLHPCPPVNGGTSTRHCAGSAPHTEGERRNPRPRTRSLSLDSHRSPPPPRFSPPQSSPPFPALPSAPVQVRPHPRTPRPSINTSKYATAHAP